VKTQHRGVSEALKELAEDSTRSPGAINNSLMANYWSSKECNLRSKASHLILAKP